MRGWPVLVPQFGRCSYNTRIECPESVWAREHTCKYCGSKSKGGDITGESKGAMNSAQHDELAQLFAQNMQLSHQQHQQQTPITEQAPQAPEKIDSPIHFASAHYTHTAHVRSETQSEPSRSPPPPYHVALMPQTMADTMRQNSIDPSSLLPNQIDLFLNADYEQRLRLLELWRISPPSYPLEKQLPVTSLWAPTSVEREENEARERYEKQMTARVMPQEEHMLDTFVIQSDSSVRGAGEPAWPSAAGTQAVSANSTQQHTDAEPYIVNGYEIASNKHSVDPVYAAGLWTAPNYAHATQQQTTMEDQYGMYEQIRNHADWERTNEQIARERLVSLHNPIGMDDEMSM